MLHSATFFDMIIAVLTISCVDTPRRKRIGIYRPVPSRRDGLGNPIQFPAQPRPGRIQVVIHLQPQPKLR